MDESITARTIEEAAQKACKALGVDFRPVPMDGAFHRLTVNSEHQDGSLKLFKDGQGGIAWNFKTGEPLLFFVDGTPEGITEAERRKLKRKRHQCWQQAESEREAVVASAAARALRLWQRVRPARQDHPYLLRKAIKSYDLRQSGKFLVVPVRDSSGNLTSLQMIAEEGTRRFLKGSRLSGSFHVLGDAEVAPILIIAEGFATAATIHEATGLPVIIAFCAGNLQAVARIWRQKRWDARIIIAADDDWQTRKPVKNPGLTKARAAADAAGAIAAVPDFTGVQREKGDTDFNDLARLRGLAEVKRQFDAVIEKPVSRLRKFDAYEAGEAGLVWHHDTAQGTEHRRLTNFLAWIVAQRIKDNGAEQQKFLDMVAEIHGREIRFTISARAFEDMSWVIQHVGADAVVEPGLHRDRTRTAIQYLSGHIPQYTTYQQTGWRELDGYGRCYLHEDGAIGRHGPLADVDVDTEGRLPHYRLPTHWPPEQVMAGVRASLKILDVAPDRVTVPLLGATYRAVFGDADFAIHFAGITGSGKSQLTALAQQHFGAEMVALKPPGSWASSPSNLEGLMFMAKDALLVIDDFVLEGTAADRAAMQQKAVRIFRAVGNTTSRGRAGCDGKPLLAKPPRALVTSSGEVIPLGHSLRARVLIVEVDKTTIGDLSALTPFQDDAAAGLYATAMAGFIQWLAADFEAHKREFREEVKARRDDPAAKACHARTTYTRAQLAASWHFILRFACECGAIDTCQAAPYQRRVDEALQRVAAEQAEIQGACNPVDRFCELFSAAVGSGRVHIAGADGGVPTSPATLGWRKHGADWQPRGDCVGWEDGRGGFYLEPEASFAAAQALGMATGDSINIGSKTLRQHLRQRGLLYVEEDGRLTVRRMIGGRRRHVAHVANLLSLPEQETAEEQRKSAEAGSQYADAANGQWSSVAQKENVNGAKWASGSNAQGIEPKQENHPADHMAHLARESEDEEGISDCDADHWESAL